MGSHFHHRWRTDHGGARRLSRQAGEGLSAFRFGTYEKLFCLPSFPIWRSIHLAMNEERATPAADPAPHDPAQDWPGGRLPPPCSPAQIAMLDELADIGMAYARQAAELGMARIEAAKQLTETRKSAGPAKTPLHDAAFYDALHYDPTPEQRRFEQMARTVQRTLSLKARLLLDLAAWDKRVADAAAALERRLAEKQKTRRAEVQRKASNIVGEVIEKTHGEGAAIAAMRPVARWFDERDDFSGLFDRPIGEIVAMICRDLGRPMDWRLWQKRPWGADAMAAAQRPAAAPRPDRPETPDAPAASSGPAATDTAPTRARPAVPPEVSASPPDAKPGEPPARPVDRSGTGAGPPPDH